ncbi:RagB/SusD family nutrient uptake outer membrane protein [Wenyingzhuangia sp. 2_MG-2023]|uniref:RagB/SusD family nutrient uptake outer membrane protein n=1 Tax=Wenyingzhuangia sp. 2_MG-2023 TaxID=3062639 RepID=UPI0026E23FBD|nr:RagB/SusD family nutrient uptake outer membrane protein [Wenyingzhuangia sp. 2_MG-2023]MDO6739111.1 RagB/SusD family nutrient uptake outer membrane protein [Wenyingzhuangia sp. 2_MG-2023]
MMKLNNKIRKNIKYIYIVVILGFYACSTDYLDGKAYGVSTTENFYKTPEDAQQAITSAYAPLHEMYLGNNTNFWGAISTDLLLGDVGTDDFIKGGSRYSDNPPLLQKELYQIQTSNNMFNEIWTINYKGINYANLVIEKVPNIPFDNVNEKKQILAEAHFLRAYYYFDLVNSFGGVPLIKEGTSYEDSNMPRSTTEETYAQIEADLKIAIADLPYRFDKGPSYYGHADKGAALGYMMRVSLYQNKMDQVKKYGKILIEDDKRYSLTSDFSSIFEEGGEWNQGSIFELICTTNTSYLGTGIVKDLTPKSEKGFGLIQAKKGLRDAYVVNVDPITKDTIRDPRYDTTFYQPLSITQDGEISPRDVYGTHWFNKKYSWSPHTNNPFPTLGNTISSNNIRLLRLADVYLMYAEAIYQSDPTTAIEYVNKVRKRARESAGVGNLFPQDLPLTLTGDVLRDAIYKERRIELAGEGYRYHDLIRTGRAATVLGPLGFQIGKHEVMPIPYSQMTLSKGVLQQNNY